MQNSNAITTCCRGGPTAASVAETPVCPVCGMALDAAAVHCIECQTAHHEECWRYNRGCSTYACPSRSCVPGLPSQRPARGPLRDGERLDLQLPVDNSPEAFFMGLAAILSVVLAVVVLRPVPGHPLDPRNLVVIVYGLFLVACANTMRVQLSSSPGGDHLERTASSLGLVWLRCPTWIRRHDVVEVHVYGEPPIEVIAVCASGETRVVAQQVTRGASRDLRPAAAAVAAWADCAIVEYGNRERPTRAQLAAPDA